MDGENIFKYLRYFENEHENLTDFDCLEIRLFTELRHTGEIKDYICEFLITYGGPTVRLTIDSRYTMGELFHSWGVDGSGNRKDTILVSQGVTDGFKELIESMYGV